jgi:hypothetical protein
MEESYKSYAPVNGALPTSFGEPRFVTRSRPARRGMLSAPARRVQGAKGQPWVAVRSRCQPREIHCVRTRRRLVPCGHSPQQVLPYAGTGAEDQQERGLP